MSLVADEQTDPRMSVGEPVLPGLAAQVHDLLLHLGGGRFQLLVKQLVELFEVSLAQLDETLVELDSLLIGDVIRTLNLDRPRLV